MNVCQTRLIQLLVIGVLLTLSQGTAFADFILLSDDFNNNSLDTSKWYTVLPFGSSIVAEQNQRIELTNRGYLVTQSQINPGVVGGDLRIRGQYTFLSASSSTFDFIQIITRTAAVPGDSFGEASQGLSFTIRGDDQLRVHDRSTGATLVGPVPILIGDNQTFSFEVHDDGYNFSFFVQKVGDPSVSASLSGTSNITSALNHVAFYNREFDTGYLDDVVIDVTSVPGPSSFFMMAAGIFSLAWVKLAH